MPNLIPAALLVALASLMSTTAGAQAQLTANTLQLSAGQTSPPATLRDMAWYAGHWKGSGLGGVNEEIWSAPNGGAMLGMYRLLRDGKPVVYELLTLTERNGSLLLRLKHFGPDLKGWEERDESMEFPLVAIRDQRIFFEGLTFERNGDQEVRIYLAVRGGPQGAVREETFRYVRTRPD